MLLKSRKNKDIIELDYDFCVKYLFDSQPDLICIITEVKKKIENFLNSKDFVYEIEFKGSLKACLSISNKKCTKRTKEYWISRGHSLEQALNKVKELQSSNSARCKEYWIKKGYSKEEAKNKVKEYQGSRFLVHKESMIDQFGEIEGIRLIKEKYNSNTARRKEYWIKKGYSEEEAKNKVSEFQKELFTEWRKNTTSEEFLTSRIRRKEYWIKKGYSEEEAKNKVKEYQTRDLDFFIKKYGEIEGHKRYLKKIELWMKNNKKTNYSKISQELFREIYNRIPKDSYRFANFDYNQKILVENQNYEYYLQIGSSYIKPDFIDLETKKIIEFDGDYWHSEKIANPKREHEREIKIRELGYDLLRIKECDFYKDKQKTFERCLNFLRKDNVNI